jgi:hypothetical protein
MSRGIYGKPIVGAQGTLETVKTFGQGMLAGGILLGVGVLVLKHAIREQRLHVAAVNLYRPRTAR